MKWAHLPVAGGLYDQHPDLLDGFKVIWHEQGIYEKEQDEKRKREQARSKTRARR